MGAAFLLAMALQTPDGPGNITFLAYLDTWIIAGLVLLAVVVVTAKWLWGRFRRRNEYTDDYYYDEDYPDEW